MESMSQVKKVAFLLGDIAALYAALVAMLFLRYGDTILRHEIKVHLAPFSLLFVVWILTFLILDLYRPKTSRNRSTLLTAIFFASIIAGIISSMMFYLFFGDFFKLTPKTNLIVFSIAFILIDFWWRIVALKIFSADKQKIVFVGNSPLIGKLTNYLKYNQHLGYTQIAQISDLSPVNFEMIKKMAAEKKFDMLIIQSHLTRDNTSLKLLYNLLPLEIEFINLLDFHESIFEKTPIEETDESWFIKNINLRRPLYDNLKRIADVFLSFAIGVILSPFTILITIIIKLTSSGDIIYKQERVGKNDKLFTLYKFRTMKNGGGGPLWTEENDKRITAFGTFLRLTHLDEIPQLWNIFGGDISFTGPRPERTELAKQYCKFPYYEIRHIVKPGLTGWAQINYRSSASLEEAYEKLKYDIFYIKNRSLFLDSMIILKTIKYIFTKHD